MCEPSGPSGQSLSLVTKHEVTRSISVPPPFLDETLVHLRVTLSGILLIPI